MILEQALNLSEKTDVKHRVFYSFYYKNDVLRASQILSIEKLEGDSPVSDNGWKEVWKNILAWLS